MVTATLRDLYLNFLKECDRKKQQVWMHRVKDSQERNVSYPDSSWLWNEVPTNTTKGSKEKEK